MTGAWNVLERHAGFYARRAPDFYQSAAAQGLYDCLDRAGDRSQLTLGGAYTGGWAPTWADTHVYYGHWHMTLDEPEKRRQTNWFYLSAVDPRVRAEWLKLQGVTWVIWYPWEWGGDPAPLDGVPGLRRVYTTPEILLYRFDPAEAAAAH